MFLTRLNRLASAAARSQTFLLPHKSVELESEFVAFVRKATTYRSGALKPRPNTTPFGLVGVLCAVVPGLFIGAAISKSVANFLEENDLFVPSDDDDDED